MESTFLTTKSTSLSKRTWLSGFAHLEHWEDIIPKSSKHVWVIHSYADQINFIIVTLNLIVFKEHDLSLESELKNMTWYHLHRFDFNDLYE